MDYRDSARSPPDRSWNTRDDSRKDNRDLFHRGRSPGADRNRRTGRSRSPANIDRYEPRPRARDDYGTGRDREREDRRRITSPPANIDRYVPGQPLHQQPLAAPQIGGLPAMPPSLRQMSTRPPLTNPIPDPLKLPYQVGFSFFGEWWRANEKIKEDKEFQRTGRRREPERPRGIKETPEEREREKAKIQAAYDAYKEEVQARMAQTFVKQHKEEQWFIERYVPEVRNPIRQQLNDIRKSFYAQWEQDLEAGLFDEFTLEGLSRSDAAAAAGAATDKEEGETTINEGMGVSDLVPATSAADLRDSALSAPTLLIKTIAPSVSRQNLEAFCRENLGEGEGGYRWLSLSDPNPSKRYHRIGWIMLNPGPGEGFPAQNEDGDVDTENPQAVSIAERALAAVNGKTVKDEVRGDFTCHVGVHNPPSQLRKKALWDLFSAPERIDRDLQLVQRLVTKFENDLDPSFNGLLRVEEKVDELRNTGRLQPVYTSSARTSSAAKTKKKRPRVKKQSRALDMDVSLDFDTGMAGDGDVDDDDLDEGEEYDEEDGEEEGEELEDGVAEDEIDDEYLTVQKKQLDLLIDYLRRVFNFCFFCVFESDSVHELTRKCPGGHLRRPRNTLMASAKEVARATAQGEPFPATAKRSDPSALGDAEEGELPQEGGAVGGGADRRGRAVAPKSEQQLLRAYNWVKTFEEKIQQILDPGSVDLRKFGGKPIEEAMASELAKYVKQEDEHKYRCKLPECTKLFKEEHFWRKHVEKRHIEWYNALKAEFELVNAYASDPAHIAPSRADANSNGHFPSGAPPTGTPRGFNLNSYGINSGLPPMPGFSAVGGGPNGSGTSYNMYNPVAMQVPGSWQSPGGLGGPVGAGAGSQGPIRRGGGGPKYNSRAGPYERRPMRWNPDGGLIGGPSNLYSNFASRSAGGIRGGGGGGFPGAGLGGGGGAVGGMGSGNGGAGGGRWSDVAGPREAIQGRTIKSYEDLDQVGNGGGGELNY